MAVSMALIAFLVGFCFAARAEGDDAESRADNIRAAFIYKFTAYITWPETDAENFTIALLGKTNLLRPLREIARDRKVGEKPLVIKECATLEDTTGAKILLVSAAPGCPLESILKKADSEKILTVGSTPGFAEKGVAINLCVIENRVGFEMNLGALKRAGLSVSSQLVSLAKLVEDTVQTENKGQPE